MGFFFVLFFLFLLFWNLFTAEDSFLSAIINYTNSSTVHFKLSPTYVLYMACRYVLSSQYRPDVSPTERTHKVIAIVNKMVSMMEGVIQVSASTPGPAASVRVLLVRMCRRSQFRRVSVCLRVRLWEAFLKWKLLEVALKTVELEKLKRNVNVYFFLQGLE